VDGLKEERVPETATRRDEGVKSDSGEETGAGITGGRSQKE